MARVGGTTPTTPSPREDQLGELVARVQGSVDTYALNARRDGYKVSFHIPLSEADEILKLNGALHRLVLIEIRRRKSTKPGLHAVPDPTPNPFEGMDDEVHDEVEGEQ